MVHPDHVLEPADALDLPEREPVYALSEGITSRRLGDFAGQALARAPELGEWVEPSLLAARGWPAWKDALARAHADPAEAAARERLAYDEIFANQLALMLVRAWLLGEAPTSPQVLARTLCRSGVALAAALREPG